MIAVLKTVTVTFISNLNPDTPDKRLWTQNDYGEMSCYCHLWYSSFQKLRVSASGRLLSEEFHKHPALHSMLQCHEAFAQVTALPQGEDLLYNIYSMLTSQRNLAFSRFTKHTPH
ncbi:hypothetical protein CEXT_124451 [Caerostris extrusa]|uniref:Uncharacterized protein n=1 Tax=Caerostris extrusa TaxID=172846 RepID=A0AAV4SS96_CAEEX|nr:hypothetical protein CEXT_124451 [Caerostris extrusa]